MALFSRKQKTEEKVVEVPQVENRNNSEAEYNIPVGLDFLTNYMSKGEATAVSAFFSGLQLISNTIASIPIHIRDIKSGELVEEHSIYNALEGGLLSKFTLLKQIIWDLYTSGNGVFYIKRAADGSPVEFIYTPAGSYTIMYNEMNRKLYYLFPSITARKVEPINVIHLVMNSKDGIQGKGIPLFARKLLDIALATDNHAKNYFEHGASISGILKSSRPMDMKQKLDAKASWEAAHGNGRSGGVAVLGNDWTYEAVGASANDAEMIETREFNAKAVCQYLCIDPLLLGIAGAASYNSIEQAQLSFLSHCIYPLISLIEAEFNRKLIRPSERGRIYIDFDENHIMFADKSATANYYSTLVKNGIMTINEARHNLGYSPVDGGDKNIIPFTDLSENTINSDDEEEEVDKNNIEENND